MVQLIPSRPINHLLYADCHFFAGNVNLQPGDEMLRFLLLHNVTYIYNLFYTFARLHCVIC